MAKQSVCTLCGYAGSPKRKTKGNFLIEVILWLFFLIPGLIYSIWRLSTKQDACPKCGSTNMIPQDTPQGQKLMSEQPKLTQADIERSKQEEANNKHNHKVLWILAFIFFGLPVIFGIIAGITGDDEKEKASSVQQAEQSNAVLQSSIVDIKELEKYQKAGKTWRNVIIPQNTSQKDLIALAKDLHKQDPKSYFHIFDDDAKFQEYMNWDINYGKVKDKDGKIKTMDKCSDVAYCKTLVQQEKYAYPFPKAWGDKHEIAIINEMGSIWKLSTPLGIEMSNL